MKSSLRYAVVVIGLLTVFGAAWLGVAARARSAGGSPSWRSLPPAPIAGRIDASVVWTGSEMVVWGGVTRGGRGQIMVRSDGAVYDPRARKWRGIAGAPLGVLGGGGPAAAWTGSRMVVYVGNSPDGPAAAAMYDPRRNVWKRLPAGPLGVREQYASVWTGRELLVFGGHGGDRYASPTAAALIPATGSWRRLKALDAIVGLAVVNGAVWNGHEAFVAGQLYRASNRFSGPILFGFDPQSNKVRTVDLSKAPLTWFERMWLRPIGQSGSEIVFAAGTPSASTVIVRYNPATGRWRKAKAAPCGTLGQIGWTGDRLVTGCATNRVAIYSPRTDSWSTVPAGPSALNSRQDSTIVWTGRELIVWSGAVVKPYNPTPADGASLALGRTVASTSSSSAADARLVYVRDFRTSHPSFWIARADGSGARMLAAGLSPAISPDGRLVAYIGTPVSAGERLMLIAAAGGRARLLRSASLIFAMRWSPGGKRLAVAEQTVATGTSPSRLQIVTIDVANGRVRATVPASLPYSMSFSPDGSQLAYTWSASANPPRDDIYIVPAGGGRPMRVTHDGHSMLPVWGPNWIVFTNERPPTSSDPLPKQNLYLIKPSGAGLHRLTRVTIPARMFGFTPLAWSANGRRLIAEWSGLGTGYVVTVDPRSGRVNRVGQPMGVGGAGLSKDGRTILGVQEDRRTNRESVVTLPYQGGRASLLVRDAISPSWSR
jgi:hypothetical protein